MMDRGAAAGCGVEEKPFPVSRAPASIPARESECGGVAGQGTDLFSQAAKALIERSPFDVAPSEKDGGQGSGSGVTTLPAELIGLLTKYTDGRMRHKKLHSGVDSKKKASIRQKRLGTIWIEREVYFRELTLADIETFFDLSKFLTSVCTRCLAIPEIGDSVITDGLQCANDAAPLSGVEAFLAADTVSATNKCGNEMVTNGLSGDSASSGRIGDDMASDGVAGNIVAATGMGDEQMTSVGVSSDSDAATSRSGDEVVSVEFLSGIVVAAVGGSGDEMVVDSERVMEKNDMQETGNDGCDVDGKFSPPHSSSSSSVSVEWVLGSKNKILLASERPSKKRKLLGENWMPEVFVEDTKLMEPIVNVNGIKETRLKLICSICKVKYGACVRFSYGTCRASFHPICAREANLRTEIWGKVELRAFCSKHSDIPAGNEDVLLVDSLPTIRDDISQPQAMCSSAEVPDRHNESESNRKIGDICDLQLEALGVSKKLSDEFVDVVLQNGAVGMDLEPENCRLEQSVDAEAFQINHIGGVKPSVASILKMFIDLGKVNVKEIALEMGIPPDSLAATLATGTLTPDSQNKAISWLRSHAFLGNFQRNIRLKIKYSVCSDSKLFDITLEPDAPSAVPVKSLLPRRRTHSNMRLLDVDGNSFLLKDKSDDESMLEETQVNNFAMEPNGCDTLAITEPEKPSFVIGGTEGPPFYIHMSVYDTLMQMKSDIPFSDADNEPNVFRLKQGGRMKSSTSDVICRNHDTKSSTYGDSFYKDGLELEQLSKAKVLGIFDMAPEDDLEGEIVYFQYGLVTKAVKSLPSQINFLRSQRWDSVFVNKYLADVREVKKQGRKAKRHKETQAVLAAATAAATAAAASSSRISTFRKDDLDESSSPENPVKAGYLLRPGLQSQLMPRPKEMMSRVALPKVTPEKQSDFFQSSTEFNKENPSSCDVCRRPETILNSILVCSICKVAVHLDCYRSVKDFIGPWQCELCEDMASRCSQPLPMNLWEKPIPSAECVVCGGTVGAFRKSADVTSLSLRRWLWTLQSTFRRRQTEPIEGLESVTMGNGACSVCRLKKGAILKSKLCHYGHCQSTFHPSCAKSDDFYMTIKSTGSKSQHKAYCEKHSLEQRLKDENQKHGSDELKNVKQVRVEIERLRLLCERIVKREKLKRDLLICSHDILASKKDSIAFSVLVRSPFFHPDVSSDSATTSLYNSGSEAIQKSDDLTVDSTSSVKKPPSVVGSTENDRKTDDSSTSQLVFTREHMQRMPCAGKKIPSRTLSVSRKLANDSGANRIKFRKTFEKELLMTSDQASLKNSRLPKGFVYVPVEYLANDNPGNRDASSRNIIASCSSNISYRTWMYN
uniref:Uncharacterized protein n=1 Tax=Kalanchoe fedtschenkoi TaxID=63787 RepID=A0A7N0TL48_KALFE